MKFPNRMASWRRFIAVAMGVAGIVGLTTPAQAGTAPKAPVPAAMACADVVNLELSLLAEAPTVIMSAEEIAATADTPAVCKIKGIVQPQIQFEMQLPTKTWNGRYLQAGCGGYCGFVDGNVCSDVVARDFMTAVHNMGHVGTAAGMPLWATEPTLRDDYAHRSTHVIAVAAKAIAEKFYAQRPHHSYFRGCSTGGREALTEANRYPDDFDGIIGGDPAFPTRQGAIVNNWDIRQLTRDDGSMVFSADKLAVLNKAVLKACDKIDGVEDGILMEPRDCTFDVTTVQCKDGDAADCLTAEQVDVARRLYDGPRNSRGERLAPAWRMFGTELAWGDPGKIRLGFSRGYSVLGLDHKPIEVNGYRKFDFDNDMDRLAEDARYYDSIAPYASPDLSAFKARGGKLILYHGFADPTVSPVGTIDYYARLADGAGGIKRAGEWAKLYMVPGMFHCRGGDAPNKFDFVDAIVQWVEHGVAPEGIVATQFDGDRIVRTRPLFPYPAVATYTGKGDVNDAKNWRAAKPKTARDDKIDWVWAPGRAH